MPFNSVETETDPLRWDFLLAMDTSTLEFSLTAFGMNRRLAEIPLQKVYAEEDLFPR